MKSQIQVFKLEFLPYTHYKICPIKVSPTLSILSLSISQISYVRDSQSVDQWPRGSYILQGIIEEIKTIFIIRLRCY